MTPCGGVHGPAYLPPQRRGASHGACGGREPPCVDMSSVSWHDQGIYVPSSDPVTDELQGWAGSSVLSDPTSSAMHTTASTTSEHILQIARTRAQQALVQAPISLTDMAGMDDDSDDEVLLRPSSTKKPRRAAAQRQTPYRFAPRLQRDADADKTLPPSPQFSPRLSVPSLHRDRMRRERHGLASSAYREVDAIVAQLSASTDEAKTTTEQDVHATLHATLDPSSAKKLTHLLREDTLSATSANHRDDTSSILWTHDVDANPTPLPSLSCMYLRTTDTLSLWDMLQYALSDDTSLAHVAQSRLQQHGAAVMALLPRLLLRLGLSPVLLTAATGQQPAAYHDTLRQPPPRERCLVRLWRVCSHLV